MSARRSFSIMLGRISISCALTVPRDRESTSTRSPPTASVSAFRSGIVAMTRNLRAPSAPETIRTAATIRRTRAQSRLLMIAPLERMRRVGAQDERGLEEQLAHEPRATTVAGDVERMAAVGVFVTHAEAEELRRIEGYVRFHGPLIAGRVRELGGVVAHAERPATPRLQFAPAVPPEAVPGLLLEQVGRPVAIDVHAPLGAADRIDSLTPQREQRMQPAFGTELVLQIEAQQGTAQAFRGFSVRDRGADLEGLRFGEVEERHHAARRQRMRQQAPPERRLVVAIEDPAEHLDVKRQELGDPCPLDA